MLPILVAIQSVGIFVMFVEILYVFYQKPSRAQNLFLILLISSLVNTIGYLFELMSTNFESSLLSVKFAYVGKSFILLAMLFFFLDYCHVVLPNTLKSILFIAHTLCTVLALTCEHHKLFYRSIVFETEGLFPHIVVSYGPYYYLYAVLIIIYMIMMPYFCIKRFRKTNDYNEKKQLIFLITVTLIPILAFLVFLSGVTKYYDVTAPSYVLSTVILLFAIFRNNLFDTLAVAKDNVVENLTTGVVVIDNSYELLYANAPAKKLFPELCTNSYQSTINSMLAWRNSPEIIFFEENVYSGSIQDLYYKDSLRGKMFVLDDISTSYNYTKNLEHEIRLKTSAIEQMQHAIIYSFASMIEARDGVTGQHVKRTSAYVHILAQTLREKGYYPKVLTDQYLQHLINAAPLHDIGKIAIPDAILCKPGRLTPEEFDTIKTHAQIGAQMIEDMLTEVEHSDYLAVARDVAHYHHERWDGAGYPSGLRGEEIPLAARIMAISDVYDALISKRTYKDSFSKEKAFEIIKEGRGTQFDPVLVDIFEEVIDKIEKVSGC